MKKGVGKSYTHHNCLSMEKYFLKHAIHVFFDKKNQNSLKAWIGGLVTVIDDYFDMFTKL